jgi:hypothetical protein
MPALQHKLILAVCQVVINTIFPSIVFPAGTPENPAPATGKDV